MRLHISDLKEGDILLKDTFNGYGLHVLSQGTILQQKDIAKLFQHQVDYVDIEDRRTTEQPVHRTLETTVNPKWLPNVRPDYENAVKGFQDLFQKATGGGVLKQDEVAAAFQPLLKNFQMERDVVSMLLLLNTADDYTYQHSVQVGMLSYYLASWLGYTELEALEISKAGYLHDIGKSRIPSSILNKPAKLTDQEFEEVKKHTIYGHEIILQSFEDMPDIVAVSALQHHERNDGSGYPHGLRGDEIHPVAKLIAVVDIYSAMISERVYKKKRDLFFVLKELYKMSFNELDAQTTHTFIKHMIPNFIGKKAVLESGEVGNIVMTHPTEFFRPLIQVGERFIDLTIDREYEIKEIIF
ncbi:HD-GYP domain-containing protein [Paenibacillus glycanilyticus]|uniref:HD-GYP domain-containing protein n=1 Tax=Paenibacillus glycanilyticus TaxID=126569 RepID=UPI00204167AF|nr:HD-GYP domain-containing protein [Paenibacillus glycanilyticus]MCM3631194.1 HD-GYP domain-containing protein [Paenibacillus glycanilyticus]